MILTESESIKLQPLLNCSLILLFASFLSNVVEPPTRNNKLVRQDLLNYWLREKCYAAKEIGQVQPIDVSTSTPS